MKRLLALALAGAALASCSTTQARVPVEVPALDVPPVPPRLIEPAPPPPPPPPIMEPVGDLPPVSPTTNRPRPQPPRDASKPEVKTEPPPVEAAAPPAAPAATPAVPPLRTPNTPDGNEAARQIRELNDRARALLNSTDYQALSDDRKAVYNDAKRIVTLAEDAMKAANFVFARNLAEKAEKLARELQGR